MNVVIDASVAVKWFLSDDPAELDVKKAEHLLIRISDKKCEAFQPVHWTVEVLSVIARKTPERAKAAYDLLAAAPIIFVDNSNVYETATRLATQLKHHMFDTLYHAVALANDATLVTADEAYFAKAHRLGQVQLLANFSDTDAE